MVLNILAVSLEAIVAAYSLIPLFMFQQLSTWQFLSPGSALSLLLVDLNLIRSDLGESFFALGLTSISTMNLLRLMGDPIKQWNDPLNFYFLDSILFLIIGLLSDHGGLSFQ